MNKLAVLLLTLVSMAAITDDIKSDLFGENENQENEIINNIEDWNPEHKKICFVVSSPKTVSAFLQNHIKHNADYIYP